MMFIINHRRSKQHKLKIELLSTAPKTLGWLYHPAVWGAQDRGGRAHVYFYDQQGGGVETSFKQDKQGLGMTKRPQKRFAAQQRLVQLGALAHNVTLWAKGWQEPAFGPVPTLRHPPAHARCVYHQGLASF